MCRRWCRTGRVIEGNLESIAELMFVTHIRVIVFLAIGGLVTLDRFAFARSSRIGFVVVVLLVVKLVYLLSVTVESFAIAREVRGTRKHKETTANINLSKRVLY